MDEREGLALLVFMVALIVCSAVSAFCA